MLTTSINQTAWTFSWNEPSTPALSKYWYTVAKQVPAGGTTQVVPRREFASKGPGTFVQIMVVGLRPRNTYTVTIIPCSDSLCYIPSTLTATTLGTLKHLSYVQFILGFIFEEFYSTSIFVFDRIASLLCKFLRKVYVRLCKFDIYSK